MITDYLEIAKTMYGKELPNNLVESLIDLDALCERCGGSLRSRQLIAFVVMGYNASEKP